MRKFGAAITAYFILAALLTWPLVFHMHDRLFGDFGDTRGWAWWIWAKSHGFLDGGRTDLIVAPFGFQMSSAVREPLSQGLVVAIARLSDEIFAINAFVLISLSVTAAATYF